MKPVYRQVVPDFRRSCLAAGTRPAHAYFLDMRGAPQSEMQPHIALREIRTAAVNLLRLPAHGCFDRDTRADGAPVAAFPDQMQAQPMVRTLRLVVDQTQ